MGRGNFGQNPWFAERVPAEKPFRWWWWCGARGAGLTLQRQVRAVLSRLPFVPVDAWSGSRHRHPGRAAGAGQGHLKHLWEQTPAGHWQQRYRGSCWACLRSAATCLTMAVLEVLQFALICWCHPRGGGGHVAVPQNALPGAAEPALLRPTDALWGWPVVAEVTLRLPKEHGGSLEDEPWGGSWP